jgi:hypothetical protein
MDDADPPLEAGTKPFRHPLRGPHARADQQMACPGRVAQKLVQAHVVATLKLTGDCNSSVPDNELAQRSVSRSLHKLIPIRRQPYLLDRTPHAAGQRLYFVSVGVPTYDHL